MFGSLPGSPPQVRGKLRNSRRTQIMHWDHPRRCGENLDRDSQSPARMGSPPQVRGKLQPIVIDKDGVRITPAGAGKTA